MKLEFNETIDDFSDQETYNDYLFTIEDLIEKKMSK